MPQVPVLGRGHHRKPHVTCAECRGACCEELRTPSGPRWAWMPWTRGWLRARGLDPATVAMGVTMAMVCPHLGPDGRCQCYEDRPLVCMAYPEGGPDCLEVQRRRRPHQT